MSLKTLSDLPGIRDKAVLLRLDFNVPVENGVVTDDYRIRKSLPTINVLREKGAKIIIASHTEGKTDTLRPVYEHLKNSLPITFCEDCLEAGSECVQKLNPGEILLCENIRLYDGEKKNDEEFAKKLASLAEFYVNDAFSVSHRKHASIVSVPRFLPSYIGLQFEEEVKNLSACFNPEHLFVFILGGAKFDTKMPLVEKFLTLADTVFVGGALANDVFKAKGYEVGTSLVAESALDLSLIISNPKIMLPSDVVVNSSHGNVIKAPDTLKKDEAMLDAGTRTIEDLRNVLSTTKTILWNGPLGNYEKGYKQPTLELAKMIAEQTQKNGARSILGGGDTLDAIAELGNEQAFTFVSTGGGAMLDFLAKGTLPGLDALKK